MTTSTVSQVLTDLPPFSPEKTQQLLADFYRDGYLYLPSILQPQEVHALKQAVDNVFTDPRWATADRLYGDYVAVRLFETDPVFEDMLTREPITSLVESILGQDCHLVAENVVRNRPGQAIDNFHVDDLLILPIGTGMTRHDPRMHMPVFLLTVQIPLTDIPALQYGPTEYVPGSHYAGQHPNDKHHPTFEGNTPVPIFCRAGDIYLHNGQCWHRGAPNTSDRTRYLFQLSFGMRWVSQRFFPFVNYQLPPHVLARADDRRRRVLGIHPKGAYG
ncbi:MAG: phytanoyl-CoA dioxygenase family protein [Chloroflexi bacterium]|nr:phytanoyl-CoA dioxygenase family protein [Chloroflexota bacterium]